MFEFLLVMLTITSPILIVVFIRHFFDYKSPVFDESEVLLQSVQSKQEMMEHSLNELLERIAKLELEKRTVY